MLQQSFWLLKNFKSQNSFCCARHLLTLNMAVGVCLSALGNSYIFVNLKWREAGQ